MDHYYFSRRSGNYQVGAEVELGLRSPISKPNLQNLNFNLTYFGCP
jgi:hypothetical protein